MDKLPVGQLPDLQQSNNDDEIMVITNSEYSQLKKEKISDLITDFTSTNENNALTKGTDGKMFVTDFGNASNITEGTLPVSVLPNIPKDKLPEIETDDLPDSGITAGTYTYPTDIVINSKGQVTSITEGQPGANNANQDLSNLGPLGLDKLNQSKALETGSVSSDADVYADVLKYKNSGIGTGIDTIKPDDYTVVGNPAITEDGVASGFSTANYITHGITINSSDDFEIIIPVKLNQLSNLQYFAHIIGPASLRQEGNIIAFDLLSTETTPILPYFALVSNVQIDTKYYCKLKKVGNTYIAAYKTNDIDWVIVKNVTSNLTMRPITSLVLGNSADKQHPLTDGEIDLNDIQVYINGNLVYQPCLKIPYTESKTGSKIVDAAYRDRVQDMYEQYGYAPYYTIDEENQNFTLPAGEVYGMISNTRDFSLNKTQITNCILEAPNGVATFSGSTFTVKQGLKVLIPNGRNEDKTLKNIEYTVPEDKTINFAGIGNKTFDFTLLYGNTGVYALSQNYQEADTPPTFYGDAQYYLNTKENIMYFNNNNERWEPRTVAVLGKGKLENGVVTSFTPYQPVELLKRSDLDNIQQIQAPYIKETYVNGTSWYRIWSDGWCEQGGRAVSFNTVTLPKTFKNTNYTLQMQIISGEYCMGVTVSSINTNSFYFGTAIHGGAHENRPNVTCMWYACGF